MSSRTQVTPDRLTPLLLQALFRRHHTPTDPVERPYCFESDRFAFANETPWNFVKGRVQPQGKLEPAQRRIYTRYCFVMVRAALQFWKFARFDSTLPPLPDDELARRIRQVCRRSVWLPPLPMDQRIVFPGYPNLYETSAAAPGIFQEHMGKWWPVYYRPGNFPICLPVSRRNQAHLNGQLLCDLQAGYPSLLWLYRFPSLEINHTILLYDVTREDDRIRYKVYDPNYADSIKELIFERATQTFTFAPTYYFKGGAVTARAIYRGYFE